MLVRYDVREEIRASGIGKDDGLVNPVEVEPVASNGVPDVEGVGAGAIQGPAREGGMMMNGGEKKNDAAYPGFGSTSLK